VGDRLIKPAVKPLPGFSRPFQDAGAVSKCPGRYRKEISHALQKRPRGQEWRQVVHFSPYTSTVTAGILYDAIAGNDYCNGKIALTAPNDPMPNLRECLHADDVRDAVEAAGVVFDNQGEPTPSA
jgi:hypothetical protein